MPATASSAPAADIERPPPEPPSGERGGEPTGLPVEIGAVLALLVGAMVAIMLAGPRSGHWWGDDWALYIRQAQSLIDGDPARVAAENEFTVGASRGAAFTPPLYPWGFPAILAPFVAVVGADLDRLVIVPVLSAVVFACCWFDLVGRRLGTVAGFVAVVALTMSPLLVGWTELIQSEWPFMAVTSVVLVGLDRLAATDRLLGPAVRLGPLLALGLGTAASFSVRREGIGLVAAVAAAQLVVLVPAIVQRTHTVATWRALAVRVVAPHATALAVVLAIQTALPSTLVPSYQGTGVANVWRFAGEHVEHLADVVGVKRPWDADTVVLGSTAIGTLVLLVLGIAAAAGLALAVGPHRRRDAHLAAYAVVAFVVGASFRVAINRYVCTVAPILLLLALAAARWSAERVAPDDRRAARLGAALPVAILVAIAAGNLANVNVRLERAEAFADSGQVEWGPTHPDSVAMFEQVVALTEPTDVVGAPKARAMVLETGRSAVQVDEYRPLPIAAPPALVVVEVGTELHADLMAGRQGDDYEFAWGNTHFAIFRHTSG